jgi:hypothetical protein
MAARLPPSASNSRVIWLGAITFFLCLALAYFLHQPGDKSAVHAVHTSTWIITVTAFVLFACEVFGRQVYFRDSSGIDMRRDNPSWRRTCFKLIGLAGSWLFVALFYWIFSEYHEPFYARYYYFIGLIFPFWAAASIPYFYYIDGKMSDPHDGYWQFGRLLTGQGFRGAYKVDRQALTTHLGGWLIKAFFLPLMFIYLCDSLNDFLNFDLGLLDDGFKNIYDFSYMMVFFIDVAFAVIGYIMMFRISDTHLRWTETTLLGWFVALICYEPFWSLLAGQYLEYSGERGWGEIMTTHTPWLYTAWGGAIILLLTIYAWATVIFGLRFSNLTHRGIITNGPFRFTKHPAYVTKNISWWMISVPFLAGDSAAECARHCALLAIVNFIYYMRAKTEERNLSRDPVYREYMDWIDENGIFRFLPPARFRLK